MCEVLRQICKISPIATGLSVSVCVCMCVYVCVRLSVKIIRIDHTIAKITNVRNEVRRFDICHRIK